MKNKRCVIFGGCGFIGSYLSEAFLRSGRYEVVVFDQGSSNNLEKVLKKISIVKGDFNDIKAATKVLRQGDIVLDLVSSSLPYSSMQLPTSEIRKEILPHASLMQEACKKGVSKIIFISSGGGVYGEKAKLPISEGELPEPASPHSIGKITIEYFLQYFGKIYKVPSIVYRLSNPYGPRQIPKKGFGVIPTIFWHILEGDPPSLFDHGKLIRDFIFIQDVVDAIVLSFDKEAKHNVYNVGSGKGTSLEDLWSEIKKITGTSLKPAYVKKRPIDVKEVVLDINRFSKEFSWKPKVTLETGLSKTWEWIKSSK